MESNKAPFPKGLNTRGGKPREVGLTMVMDSGLGIRALEDLLDSAGPHLDILKLGFGTSIITANIEQKVSLLQAQGLDYFVGGTLFEAFFVRDDLDGFLRLADFLKLPCVEISDGSVEMEHDRKCELIADFSQRGFKVFSEVGKKVEEKDESWFDESTFQMVMKELQAGSYKVITESREGGNVGIYDQSGAAKDELIDKLCEEVGQENLLWEAPKKEQQVWFIQKFGATVNLGNIAPKDLIPLETLRLGLRGDTFQQFL